MPGQGEQDSSGFVFRMEVDGEGRPLSITGRRSAGWLVRYLDGKPYVFQRYVSMPWLAPFEALPETEVKLK